MLTHLNFYTSSMAAQLVEKNVLILIVDSVLVIDVALFHKKSDLINYLVKLEQQQMSR